MSRWFRFYDDALNDPKVQRLAPSLFKAWVNLLCIASKGGGALPAIAEIAFSLRMTPHAAEAVIAELRAAGLFDDEDGQIKPHNWDGRQFISDSSAERVKRHRDRRAAAGLERQWFAPKELRNAVYERDGFCCIYCGSRDNLSLDHLTPEIRGGTHDIENLATACLSCNGAKRDLTLEEFRARNNPSNVTSQLPKRPQSTEDRTEQNRTDSSLRSQRARAGRLPDDWVPDRAYAESQGLTGSEITREIERFRNYWKAKPGKDGAKLDWPATWRNWCIRAAETLGRAPPLSTSSAVTGIFVEQGTPQWSAWRAFRGGKRVAMPEFDYKVDGGVKRGWWFASEWPPEKEIASKIAVENAALETG